MKLFDVYPLIDVTPAKAEGSYFWDENGTEYLDLYGGHAVISIGHSHPTYVKYITEQLNNIGFYSNYVKIPIQNQVAEQLTKLSGYDDYTLFLCNSGAEANENAIKLASFHTGKKKIIYFSGAFHGRTAAAVACTDNPKIVAPVNQSENFVKLPFNDLEALENEFKTNPDIAGVIVEGIQGVGGVQIPTTAFLQKIQQLCNENNAVFIADEIQSGFGRSGKFFAHQHAGVTPDIIASAGKVVQSEENGLKIKEADLKKHLEGELNKVDDKLKAEEKAVKDETKKIISKDDLQNDNQLNTSLAVLKSLIIMNK